MKTTINYLALAVVVIAALAASFRTENLTDLKSATTLKK